MKVKQSKNNPTERTTQAVTTRVCDICGAEGELGAKVIRVRKNRTMIWKCKDQHYDV